jgi:hypothetical protein
VNLRERLGYYSLGRALADRIGHERLEAIFFGGAGGADGRARNLVQELGEAISSIDGQRFYEGSGFYRMVEALERGELDTAKQILRSY